MVKKLILLVVFFAAALFARNPIVPPGVYIADPSAHVWEDGKLYLYGSLDESTDYYCSWRHHVLVTEDMKSWNIEENRFASKGENDQVPYNNSLLFAPDCIFKDGNYYLYYCQPDPRHAEGVAVSKSPVGPFLNGQPIDTYGNNQIDPSVFIDDDGTTYYLWGQFTMKMARMKPNMIALDPSTVKDSVLTEWEHYFHEGAYLTKRNGIYYLVYADLSRSAMPTSIGYATSRSPFGPYEYGGVIIDNDRCDPGNWNNHGSIAEYKGQWYVFYHRATHNSKMMRKTCVEKIYFKEDGSIPEVEMTSQGIGEPLPATSQIDAAWACLLHGNVRIQLDTPDNEELGEIQNDDRVVYKYVDFSEGVDKVIIRAAGGKCSGTIQVKQDVPWGPLLGQVRVEANEKNKEWQIICGDLVKVTGIHALWLIFYSDDGSKDWGLAVDWIQFE